jgi:hypothetical protein
MEGDDPPGRDDQADAALVAAVANAVREWRATTGSTRGDLKLLREAVWFYWERPRLPRPLVRGKYPTTVLWSVDARAAYHADTKRSPGLVIEHTHPMTLLLEELLATPGLDADAARELLSRRVDFVVITADENRRLEAAGVSRQLVKGTSDQLARYRKACLDTAGFKPLSDELATQP